MQISCCVDLDGVKLVLGLIQSICLPTFSYNINVAPCVKLVRVE